MRRRLAHGKETPKEKYGWKPFGCMDYGYDEKYQTVFSWIIWALVTWGSISVNPIEAAAVLGGAVAYSEYDCRKKDLEGEFKWGTGASWVHNVQAGYCWYHHFIKGQKQLPLMLGSWAEILGDMGAIVQEKMAGQPMYSHKAHYEGASIGLGVAALFDKLNFSTKPTLWKAIPLLVIGTMIFQNSRNKKIIEKYMLTEEYLEE